VQDEITEQVVAKIATSYGVISQARFAEVKKKPTERLDAYESVLQTHAYYRDNMVATEHARVRESLERAVQSDPGNADAWAGLCSVYLDEHRFNYNPRPDSLDRALEAGRRAVVSDPNSQRAHTVLAQAHFYQHDLGSFFAETERAIALNRNNAGVLVALGDKLHLAGDERGIVWVRKAVALEPFLPTWCNFAISDYHFNRGEYEDALAAARRLDIPDHWWVQVYLAAIYAELDRQEEARLALEELLKLYPGFTCAKFVEEWRKSNVSDERIRHWVAALRKAGLPE
jgi:adenylate cyclase